MLPTPRDPVFVACRTDKVKGFQMGSEGNWFFVNNDYDRRSDLDGAGCRIPASVLRRRKSWVAIFVGRIIQLVPVLWLIPLIVFMIMHVLPGDPAELMLAGAEGGAITPERLRELHTERWVSTIRSSFNTCGSWPMR